MRLLIIGNKKFKLTSLAIEAIDNIIDRYGITELASIGLIDSSIKEFSEKLSVDYVDLSNYNEKSSATNIYEFYGEGIKSCDLTLAFWDYSQNRTRKIIKLIESYKKDVLLLHLNSEQKVKSKEPAYYFKYIISEKLVEDMSENFTFENYGVDINTSNFLDKEKLINYISKYGKSFCVNPSYKSDKNSIAVMFEFEDEIRKWSYIPRFIFDEYQRRN